jgi:hypothetical protein
VSHGCILSTSTPSHAIYWTVAVLATTVTVHAYFFWIVDGSAGRHSLEENGCVERGASGFAGSGGGGGLRYFHGENGCVGGGASRLVGGGGGLVACRHACDLLVRDMMMLFLVFGLFVSSSDHRCERCLELEDDMYLRGLCLFVYL